MNPLEITANAITTASIVLAARNSVHTWWTGIIGCVSFGVLFWMSRLYADVILQGFFVATSAYGLWHWTRGEAGHALPVRRTRLSRLVIAGLCATAAAAGYGLLLHRFTDAYAHQAKHELGSPDRLCLTLANRWFQIAACAELS